MKSVQKVNRFVSRNPLFWILLTIASGLAALGFMIALLDPIGDWGTLTPAERISLTGALVGFFGLLAAVFALVYALSEVRNIFPEQTITLVGQAKILRERNAGILSFRAIFRVPENASIVNAFRLRISLMRSGKPLSRSDAAQANFITGLIADQSGLTDGVWHMSRGGILLWTKQQEGRWFPSATVEGPQIQIRYTAGIDESFLSQFAWEGEWWTDRKGPESFNIGIMPRHRSGSGERFRQHLDYLIAGNDNESQN